MAAEKKGHQLLFVDILRSLRVVLRYAFGWGAEQTLPRVKAKGVTFPVVDMQKCVGCKLCAKTCPSKAIKITIFMQNDRYEPAFELEKGRCVLCGLCAECCPESALCLKMPEEKNVRG